mgnify:FL=1|jgi:hypothetical protein
MDQPRKPTLAEFGLTERDIGQVPQLLAERIDRVAVSRIGVGTAAVIGLLSVWGIYEKTGSFLSGAFFGIIIGFVVFLLASSVVAYCIELSLIAISILQGVVISRFNKRAGKVYRYQSALRSYGRENRKYRSMLIR